MPAETKGETVHRLVVATSRNDQETLRELMSREIPDKRTLFLARPKSASPDLRSGYEEQIRTGEPR